MADMTLHTAETNLINQTPIPTVLESYADLRAASRAKQRHRKRRQKYHDFRLMAETDVLQAASEYFFTPEIWTQKGLDWPRSRKHIDDPEVLENVREDEARQIIRGKRQVWKMVSEVGRPSCEPKTYQRPAVAGLRTMRGLRDDRCDVQQLEDVERGESDAGWAAMYYFTYEYNPYDGDVWQRYDQAVWDDATPQAAEDDGVGSDWHFVENWLTAVSDGDCNSDSEGWDLVSEESECGLHLGDFD